MKIYISGKITGLPLEETRRKFADAQALLEEIGFEVVNPMEEGLSLMPLGNNTWLRILNCFCLVMQST